MPRIFFSLTKAYSTKYAGSDIGDLRGRLAGCYGIVEGSVAADCSMPRYDTAAHVRRVDNSDGNNDIKYNDGRVDVETVVDDCRDVFDKGEDAVEVDDDRKMPGK